MSPFTTTTEAVCSSGSSENATTSPQSLVLTGPGFDVTVLPGEECTFSATSGDQAGSYVAKNVNVAFIRTAGEDAWSIANFTIARSP